MPLHSYMTLGRSGLRVSPLCLGAMTFGEDWGMGSSPQESEAILSRYRELGGNFLDTSNAYNNGHSEKIIGDAIGRESAKRDRMVIGTKFANNLYPGDPNGGATALRPLSSSRYAACKPTTSTCTGFITRIGTRRWRKP